MPQVEVRTRAPYAVVLGILNRLPKIILGMDDEYPRVAEACLGAALQSLLKNITEDWLIKADGQQGEDGIRWKELSIAQLKYRLMKIGVDVPDYDLEKHRDLIPILIDTHLLIKSFTAGPVEGKGTASAYRSASPEQRVEVAQGKLDMSSSVPYAMEHQDGLEGRIPPLPRRQMVADVFPSTWIEAANEAFRLKLVECLVEILGSYGT